MNYPSFMVLLSGGETVKVNRTVMNVGAARLTYSVQAKAPRGASVTVQPKKLGFGAPPVPTQQVNYLLWGNRWRPSPKKLTFCKPTRRQSLL